MEEVTEAQDNMVLQLAPQRQGVFCPDHIPLELWHEIFKHLDDHDPVAKMSFSFWKLVTVPSVCRLWHTMLSPERKKCKLQFSKYQRSVPYKGTTIQSDVLADPWFSLYVRNQSPTMISENHALFDFISVMLSGGTTQTKLDLRRWISENRCDVKDGKTSWHPRDTHGLGATFWCAHLGNLNVIDERLVCGFGNSGMLQLLLKNGHVRESVRYWSEQALQSQVPLVDWWIATAHCRHPVAATVADLEKSWHEFLSLLDGIHSKASMRINANALVDCKDEHLAVMLAHQIGGGNLYLDDISGLVGVSGNMCAIEAVVTRCLRKGHTDLARTLIQITGNSCESLKSVAAHIYHELDIGFDYMHLYRPTGQVWRKLVHFLLDSNRDLCVFDVDARHFFYCLGFHGDVRLANSLPCPVEHTDTMITGCIQGMNHTMLDFLLQQQQSQDIFVQTAISCALKTVGTNDYPSNTVRFDPYPALLKMWRHSHNNHSLVPLVSRCVGHDHMRQFFTQYPLCGTPIDELMAIIRPDEECDHALFIVALMQQPGNEQAIATLLQKGKASLAVNDRLTLILHEAIKNPQYLELYLSHIGPSSINEAVLPRIDRSDPPVSSQSVGAIASLVMEQRKNVFGVITVLNKYLPRMERLAFPSSLYETRPLRMLRPLLKVRGHLSPETWREVIFLATARTPDKGRNHICWDRPDANLLRITAARSARGPNSTLKLLCEHPDMFKGMDPLEQIECLAPQNLCNHCDPKSIPCDQRVAAVIKCLKHFSDNASKNKRNEQFLEQLLATMTREELERIATIVPFATHPYGARRFIKRYCQENMIHPDRKAFDNARQHHYACSYFYWNYEVEEICKDGIKRMRKKMDEPSTQTTTSSPKAIPAKRNQGCEEAHSILSHTHTAYIVCLFSAQS